MRIIPAIDIIDGKCVRLSQGDYNQKTVYNEDPLEVAKEFEANGIQYLHLVDLDGAKSAHVVNWKVLERIASQTSLKVDFGGGVKTDEDIKMVFESGAKQVTGGSIAVKDSDTFEGWIEKYGSDNIILGADAKDGMIATHGWLESSELEVVQFIKQWNKKGIQYVICTDIAKDGMLQGPSYNLYRRILSIEAGKAADQIIPSAVDNDIKLIASGGVASVKDLHSLREIGCEGAIVGKAFYEGRISFKELREFV
ncbi:1-(5-phosphoribosyl)-5-[(5-phosphoribosylamino)methylideneamino] imidazole-4-carboxamide isomerase [Nonlabens sp. Hel1_33_55]|uniref:1-(5-phosphoribosyl)-5-[(5- phosphoribosylamino)methylideneamino]imidazole-4- carboxamide isomerase n=1 Tax=Nonlabens sp. Hel1_33_55 TaxID=1336802 RepID=UPI000875BACF|nr:1-(5-phosphoribosyl)-5-[(5-phosphoribosylamino)methylideneamino]imidazole-4-carboxamide isomerase [Nonlabens sp. Hel1_33_55]SCY23125.1 1-(5-phosphoribosyl)-5-[(5-phosphoribosylamino)methylideneamino] imidazole-4-carboxamide isomerase [Nonlabens sp. Hel1_33_55]